MSRLASLRFGPAAVDVRVATPLPAQIAYSDPRRGSASARGYGAAWRLVRQRVLDRDSHRCAACAGAGRVTPARCVDHIVPKEDGGGDEMMNLQALCQRCHDVKTATEKAARRAGSVSPPGGYAGIRAGGHA